MALILAYLFLNLGKSSEERFKKNKQGGNALSRQALEDKEYVARRLKAMFENESTDLTE